MEKIWVNQIYIMGPDSFFFDFDSDLILEVSLRWLREIMARPFDHEPKLLSPQPWSDQVELIIVKNAKNRD